MLGRNGNTAYVRYDSQGRIVAGGPIISPIRPKNGNWRSVSSVIGSSNIGTNGNVLRAFIRLDMFGRVVPSSLVIQTKEPLDANSGTGWLEICASVYGITTTTSTSSSSTTTTSSTSSTSTTTSTSTSTTTTTSTSTSTTTTSTTSTTTTINPDSLVNTIFVKYDVIPGDAPGTNTVFVKYDVY